MSILLNNFNNYSTLFFNINYNGNKFLNYYKNKSLINPKTIISETNTTYNLRGLLSNETVFYELFNTKLFDNLIIILFIIVFIFMIILILFLYKKWKNKKNVEIHELSDKAKINYEANLNAKTFSFLPLSSPIKLKENTPKSNESIKDEKKTDDSELSFGSPGKLEYENNFYRADSVIIGKKVDRNFICPVERPISRIK